MERSFKDAYVVLQRHAETLRNQDEPNIDDLLTIVTESVEAYKVCKERIDAVDAALKVALDGASVGGVSPPSAERSSEAAAQRAAPASRAPRAQIPSPSDDMEDDIPF